MDTTYTNLALKKRKKKIFILFFIFGQGRRGPVQIGQRARSGPRAGGCPWGIDQNVTSQCIQVVFIKAKLVMK